MKRGDGMKRGDDGELRRRVFPSFFKLFPEKRTVRA